jgi:hypothetical protein
MSFAGAWTSTVAYVPGAVVTYQGVTYVALIRNTGAPPNTHATDWALLSTPGTYVLVDANGTIIGPFQLDFVYLTINGQKLPVEIDSFGRTWSTTGTNVTFGHTTSDCSGTRYFINGQLDSPTGVSSANVLYYPPGPYTQMTFYSQEFFFSNQDISQLGTCNSQPSGFSSPASPVATFDLNTLGFVAPFSKK